VSVGVRLEIDSRVASLELEVLAPPGQMWGSREIESLLLTYGWTEGMTQWNLRSIMVQVATDGSPRAVRGLPGLEVVQLWRGAAALTEPPLWMLKLVERHRPTPSQEGGGGDVARLQVTRSNFAAAIRRLQIDGLSATDLGELVGLDGRTLLALLAAWGLDR
jgi:hypothetical protein